MEKPELRQGQTLRALQVTCTFLYARTTDTQRGIVFTVQPKSNPNAKFLGNKGNLAEEILSTTAGSALMYISAIEGVMPNPYVMQAISSHSRL